MRRLVVGLLLAALCLSAFVPAGSAATPTRYIVGYDSSDETAALAAIQLAGGDVQRTSDDLSFAVVHVDDPFLFEQAMATSPHVQYVELDDKLRLTASQWNAAQWNGAQWNAAQWNGAQWNGAQWNSGEWNGAQWNDADLKNANEDQRAAAKWTEKHFQASGGEKIKYAGDRTDPGIVWQWGQWATDTTKAWTRHTYGTQSASVCVLDSGVAWDHPDIAPNYAAGWNAIEPSASAYDDAGHGTHVAGIAAAAIGNGYGTAGVGNVRILNAKVLSADGTGYESDLAFGLTWCARQGADVAMMALGVTETDHPTLQRALQFNADRDVLMLASAGNGGCSDCVSFPASDPRVVAVAAVDGNLTRATFSSQGPQVELAAPGVSVISTFPGSDFRFGSGTSQAVAYAAGAAALLRDDEPSLTAEQARARLVATAKDLGAPGRDAQTGVGLVDVLAAVRG